jgi:hypothetical protein
MYALLSSAFSVYGELHIMLLFFIRLSCINFAFGQYVGTPFMITGLLLTFGSRIAQKIALQY